jgi:hypothetical protein
MLMIEAIGAARAVLTETSARPWPLHNPARNLFRAFAYGSHRRQHTSRGGSHDCFVSNGIGHWPAVHGESDRSHVGPDSIVAIPPLNPSGTLPPFTGASSGDPGMSPYIATMREISGRFCTTQARADLFRDWVRYRKALVALGLTGFQWIDGSYCEDIERIRARGPADIDIVNLVVRPPALLAPAAWLPVYNANIHLFDRAQVKAAFRCDSFFVDVGFPAFAVHAQLTYYFGLFTHQRISHLWKGMLQVPLSADDDDALNFVDSLTFAP